ncbi:glycosyl transferase family 6 [[Clostridium] spiroforme]|nr:glycosyl transferase family 6 [Thomasclavelia spiroformis]
MKKIGILYICTGDYVVFWQDFFESFEKYFIKDCQIHYFVFTDAKSIFSENNDRVHKYYIENLPWPLITLFRFRTFLKAQDDLKKMDYLMFSNANMVCNQEITAKEFLPRKDKNENLIVVIHPGYSNTKLRHVPYDRNRKSKAYVPYNKGKHYVIGAMNGGTTEAFLEMSQKLNRAIEEDLKKNVIARWHDESHLNKYIIDRDDVRYLSPEYCYPFGMEVQYKKKIFAVSKEAKFDVKKFKGVYKISEKDKFLNRIILLRTRLKEDFLCIKDKLLHKK